MFRLLSNESNIFSVPVYIGLLLLIVIGFNILDINTLGVISAVVTFAGIALGYFCFNAINLNYQSHLPLFIYTAFIIALYPGNLDIGIAVTLLTNSIILLILTDNNLEVRQNSYILVGAILALNFIFLPTTWPMSLFVILHIIATSNRSGIHISRLIFGNLLVALSYFSLAYFFKLTTWDASYFPFGKFSPNVNYRNLLPLLPVVILMLHAVSDHFRNYNKKSPTSRFKYTFLLVYSFAQLITIILYMGANYEYLLLLALPASIILSRVLKFSKKYWLQEAGLWIILFSLFFYKFSSYFNY